eukprot:scaffold434722_cov36-Prasinocladus_malaysianus.AAC.1
MQGRARSPASRLPGGGTLAAKRMKHKLHVRPAPSKEPAPEHSDRRTQKEPPALIYPQKQSMQGRGRTGLGFLAFDLHQQLETSQHGSPDTFR